jgi:hypothetical protein
MRLADGSKVPVLHRDVIMAVPSGRTLFVCQPDDTVNIIDILLVTDLAMHAMGNVSRKRRRR